MSLTNRNTQAMKSNDAAINWPGVFHMLKKLFPFLTSDELKCQKGEEETLFNKLKSKLGLPPQQLQDMMKQKVSHKKDLKKSYDISENAFDGISEKDDSTYFSTSEKPLSETYKGRNKEREKMPATKAPEKEGYDAGIKHGTSENDVRK